MTDGTQQDPGQGGRSRLRVVLIVVIALLLAGLAVLGFFFVRMLQPPGTPKEETAGGLVWVRSIYGFGPSKDEQLLEPTSVAIAPNGDIYANDAQRSRVMRFSSDGAFKSLIHTGAGGTGPGQFKRPGSIATDADGNVFIADQSAGKIIVFDDQGSFVREWAVDGAGGLTISGDTVYVLARSEVLVFSRQGQKQGSFGRRGKGRGELDAYQGIVVDGTRIYIADALNKRLQAFSRTGDVVWVSPDVASSASKPAEISTKTLEASATSNPQSPYELPQDVVFDGAGRLVVIDAFKFQMIVVDRDKGKVIAAYGDYGSRDGLFFYPTGLAYDPQRDWFAVADTRNDRIQIVRIPDTGESPQAAMSRLMTSPYRYCAVPLLLLLLAVIVGVVTRRRGREPEPLEEE
jgi:sugar lactone lactonase YvrE